MPKQSEPHERVVLNAKVNYTVSSGVITIAGESRITVTPEDPGPTDDLDTISGASEDGQLLWVFLGVGESIEVTLKDGTGNLELAADFILTDRSDNMCLVWDAALSKWCQSAKANNA